MRTKLYTEYAKEKDHLGDLRIVNKSIILNWISKKQSRRM